MSCHDRNAFLESPFVEEVICVICLDVMTNPIVMSCGNGCVIGKDCYQTDMKNCPKCNEWLFKGCYGCCVDGCTGEMENMRLCGENCSECSGKKMYADCYTSDDGHIDMYRCERCKGCVGCNGAPNNTPVICTLKNIISKMMVKCQNKGCNDTFVFEKLDKHKKVCMFEHVKCKYCDLEELKSVMVNHELNICEKRIVNCGQCKDMFKHIELKEHIEDKCPNTIIKCHCSVEVSRKHLEHHIKNECILTTIKCKYCDTQGMRSVILDHELKICEKRMVNCPQCKNVYKYDEIKGHMADKCLETILVCACGVATIRKIFNSHVINDCPLTIINCKYSMIKCDYQCSRVNMADHYRDKTVEHLSLVDKLMNI